VVACLLVGEAIDVFALTSKIVRTNPHTHKHADEECPQGGVQDRRTLRGVEQLVRLSIASPAHYSIANLVDFVTILLERQ